MTRIADILHMVPKISVHALDKPERSVTPACYRELQYILSILPGWDDWTDAGEVWRKGYELRAIFKKQSEVR